MAETGPAATSVPKPSPESIWLRGLWMLVVLVLFGLAQSVLGAAALVQFFWMLLSGHRNQPLAEFGDGLANWMAKATRFQTGASDDKPFPWSSWG